MTDDFDPLDHTEEEYPMTNENDLPDDLLDRVAQIGDDGYYPYCDVNSPDDLEPYRDLVDEYEPADVIRAFKANGFHTAKLHQNMDFLILAALDDDDVTEEFIEATRWYE